MIKRVALLISTLFEPMIISYGIAVLGGIHAGLSGNVWQAYLVSISTIMLFVLGTRVYLKRKDKTNWDISDRKKRIVPLLTLLVFMGLVYSVLGRVGDARVAQLFGVFFMWVAGFFILTLKIKASGHVGILTWFVCQLMFWFGIGMLPVAIFIPLLAWSRLILKRHTLSEVIVGFVYSILVFFVSARIIG